MIAFFGGALVGFLVGVVWLAYRMVHRVGRVIVVRLYQRDGDDAALTERMIREQQMARDNGAKR